MKYTIISLFLFPFVAMAMSFGQPKAIHGQDDRHDVATYYDAQYRELARSVAGQVEKRKLHRSLFYRDSYSFKKSSLSSAKKLCRGEAFAKQTVLPKCTAFLVSKNTIMTAGHCVDAKRACKNNVWVFDFVAGNKHIKKSNVYRCKKIIAQSFDKNKTEGDYAIIKLDREVSDRKPLTLGIEQEMAVGDEVIMIGHPTMLPLKITDNAKVLATQPLWISTNLDIFEGNSGSPVFDRSTGSVVGIAVRATHGYKKHGSCYKAIVLPDDKVADAIVKISEIEDIVLFKQSLD